MLNLRRTVHRLLDLTVPRFGPWSQLTLDHGDRLTHVSLRAGGAPRSRELRGRALDVAAQRGLRDLATRTGRPVAAADVHPDLLDAEAFGAPIDGVHVLALPLTTQAATQAVLMVAAPVDDLDGLRDLARRGARAVTVAQVYEERTQLASALRAAVVPPPLPSAPGLDLGAAYRPAMETTQVGGDFYDVHRLPRAGENAWSLTVGDVCGKGVEAAVLTGQVRQSLRTAALVTSDPAETLRIVNDTMLAAQIDNFVTMLHSRLVVGPDGVEVALACGGHPEPLLLRAGHAEPVATRGSLVGMLPDPTFRTVPLHLRGGDVLLAYTDGAVEAHGADGLLGVQPLVEEFADCAGLPAQTVADRMMQLVLEHLDGRPHDDVAFVAVRAQ